MPVSRIPEANSIEQINMANQYYLPDDPARAWQPKPWLLLGSIEDRPPMPPSKARIAKTMRPQQCPPLVIGSGGMTAFATMIAIATLAFFLLLLLTACQSRPLWG